jgi:hypothetical protein
MQKELEAMATQDNAPVPVADLSPTRIKLDYLEAHQFPLSLGYPFPRLGDIFPQLGRHKQGLQRRLRAFFVLCPQYRMTEDHLQSSYFTQAEIDEQDRREIEDASDTQSHIMVIKGKQGKVPKGRVYCSYHSWVREPHCDFGLDLRERTDQSASGDE